MDAKIHMVATASEVFSFLNKNPNSIHEDVFQYISEYINKQKIKDEATKIAMIGAAGKAFEMKNKNPTIPEKILLRDFMDEIPGILSKISE